jgi:MFS family permease
VLRGSIEHGLANPPVRWVMLASPFTGGVTIYAFYAMQPYLLELYGDERAYSVAGLAAAIVAGAQIAGGLIVPHLGRIFRRRTSVLLVGTSLSALTLALVASSCSFDGHHTPGGVG